MKRVLVGAVVLLAMVALSGCIPAAAPPPGYLPPVVDSISTPDPVQPGGTVSITVQAHDDQAISSLAISSIKVGDGRTLHAPSPCISVLDHPGGDVTQGTITVTCMVPTFADNGTWEIFATVYDDPGVGAGYRGTSVHLFFTVVGGTDDSQAPALTSYSFDPPQLYTNSLFTFTARFSDPAGVHLQTPYVEFGKIGTPNSTMECINPQETDLTPSDVQFVWSCTATFGTTQVGEYQFNIDVIDGLGHSGVAHRTGVNVAAPPKTGA